MAGFALACHAEAHGAKVCAPVETNLLLEVLQEWVALLQSTSLFENELVTNINSPTLK